jgi:hypothetical protein
MLLRANSQVIEDRHLEVNVHMHYKLCISQSVQIHQNDNSVPGCKSNLMRLALSVSCPPPVSLSIPSETEVSYLCQERQFSEEE